MPGLHLPIARCLLFVGPLARCLLFVGPLARCLLFAGPLALCILFASPLAQAQPLEGFDQNGQPAPLQPSRFSMIEASAGPLDNDSFHYSARTTLLLVPLSMSAPAASAEGTTASLSDGVVLGEFMAGYGLGNGWDLGLGFGAHFWQWGRGNRAAVGTDDALPPVAVRDPRIGVGFTRMYRNLSARPFFILSVPLGGEKALAGERATRENVGLSFSWNPGRFSWASEISFLFRQRVRFSSSTWGTQLHAATGLSYEVFHSFMVAGEAIVSPVLVSQEDRSGSSGGVVLPAEAIGSLRYQRSWWSISAGCGTGIPLSTTSSENTDRGPVRGPTSPLLRGFLQWTVSHR